MVVLEERHDQTETYRCDQIKGTSTPGPGLEFHPSAPPSSQSLVLYRSRYAYPKATTVARQTISSACSNPRLMQ